MIRVSFSLFLSLSVFCYFTLLLIFMNFFVFFFMKIIFIFSCSGMFLTSHAGVFRGVRISSLPQTAFVGREEIRAPLKTPGWEARMFRNVPECSGMFHVPGFIDAQLKEREVDQKKQGT